MPCFAASLGFVGPGLSVRARFPASFRHERARPMGGCTTLAGVVAEGFVRASPIVGVIGVGLAVGVVLDLPGEVEQSTEP